MLAILSGTNRPGSVTRRVASVTHALHSRAGWPAQVIDLADLPLEAFTPEAYANKPPVFTRFIEPVLACSGLVVVTPEYNGSFPGVLKYFIDLLPFPAALARKPVCFVGVADGQWGALRAVEHLQDIFIYRRALVCPPSVLLPQVGQAWADDSLKPEPLQRLAQQAETFRSFARR